MGRAIDGEIYGCNIVGIRIRNGRQSDPITRVPNMDGFEPNARAGLTASMQTVPFLPAGQLPFPSHSQM